MQGHIKVAGQAVFGRFKTEADVLHAVMTNAGIHYRAWNDGRYMYFVPYQQLTAVNALYILKEFDKLTTNLVFERQSHEDDFYSRWVGILQPIWSQFVTINRAVFNKADLLAIIKIIEQHVQSIQELEYTD